MAKRSGTYVSSQITVCMSSMLVGSSSSRRSGLQKRAWPSASGILQPQLKVLVSLTCICKVNPRPANITDAQA